jgi:hypothetical protein
MDELATRLARLGGLHERLGKELDALGGVLRCHACKRERPMKGAGSHLRSGWPMCCGATMEWRTARQLASENR